MRQSPELSAADMQLAAPRVLVRCAVCECDQALVRSHADADRVLAGERVVAAEIEVLLGEAPEQARQPSERQRAVVEAVARGATNREIAEELGITERTVKYHLRAVFDRLGVSNRAEAVARAAEAGWLRRE